MNHSPQVSQKLFLGDVPAVDLNPHTERREGGVAQAVRQTDPLPGRRPWPESHDSLRRPSTVRGPALEPPTPRRGRCATPRDLARPGRPRLPRNVRCAHRLITRSAVSVRLANTGSIAVVPWLGAAVLPSPSQSPQTAMPPLCRMSPQALRSGDASGTQVVEWHFIRERLAPGDPTCTRRWA